MTLTVWVVIPGYNEERYIKKVLQRVKPFATNVVVVDDGSRDATAAVAQRSGGVVLVHEVNMGKGAALKTGCEYAFAHGADAVVFLDADDQHNPEELPQFFAALEQGAQAVFGVRKFSATMPLVRMLGNKFASVFVNVLFGGYIPDIPSGYKAITRTTYDKVVWNSTGYEVEMEIAVRVLRHRLPFQTVDIATIYHDTDKGMTLLDSLAIAGKLLQWKLGL